MSKVKKDQVTSESAKQKYQVINWKSYNAALIKRGDISLYFDEEVLAHWYSESPAQRGGQEVYSDLCIETILMLKVVFKLGYRQAQGFACGLLRIMGLEGLWVPSYTQLNRRARTLDVQPYHIPQSGPIVIAIDSTGLKVYGEGEWKVRKHGWSKRRTWRKLHLGVDTQTGFIHCHVLTENNVGDESQLSDLLDQVEAPVKEACLDGAYDTEHCWDDLIERDIIPVIPPQKNAVEWYLKKPGDLPHYPRNKAIRQIDEIGRKQWKQQVGYHRRSLSETAMYRYKVIHGPTMYSRKMHYQQTENSIKIKALNIMTAQGMPVSVPRKTA